MEDTTMYKIDFITCKFDVFSTETHLPENKSLTWGEVVREYRDKPNTLIGYLDRDMTGKSGWFHATFKEMTMNANGEKEIMIFHKE